MIEHRSEYHRFLTAGSLQQTSTTHKRAGYEPSQMGYLRIAFSLSLPPPLPAQPRLTKLLAGHNLLQVVQSTESTFSVDLKGAGSTAHACGCWRLFIGWKALNEPGVL